MLRKMCHSLSVSLVLLVSAVSIQAQNVAPITNPMGALPPVVQRRQIDSPKVPSTASEREYDAYLYKVQSFMDQGPDVAVYPKDSILSVLKDRARQWIAGLSPDRMRGIQLDPYGNLLVISGKAEDAKKMFAERLASADMTLVDSAFTLLTAVKAFSNIDTGSDLAAAEGYMVRLDALSRDVSYWKYLGHLQLADVSLVRDRRSEFVTHATSAINLLPNLGFASRGVFYMSGNSTSMYLSLTDALLRTQAGKSQKEMLDKILLDASVPEKSIVAADSGNLFKGQIYSYFLKRLLDLAATMGKPAPVIYGTKWLNFPNAKDQKGEFGLSPKDGVVRIVGFGDLTGSLYIAPSIERILSQVGGSDGRVQGVMVVATRGFWGVRFMSPTEETERLVKYFQEERPSKFPIAIWAGAKEKTANGGLVPKVSQTIKDFGNPEGIFFAIIDKQGNTRRVFSSTLDFDEEILVSALIRNLVSDNN